MPDEKRKFILDIIMMFIVAASAVISIRSCQVSQTAMEIADKSSKIAGESLDNSKQQFIQLNRPYVLLSPKKMKNDQYWQVTLKDASVIIVVDFELKNVGNITAKKVSLPDVLLAKIKGKVSDDFEMKYNKPGTMAIGPGAHMSMRTSFQMQYDTDKDAERNIEYILSDKSEGNTFHIAVNYESELDPNQKYRTIGIYRIHNDDLTVIKSEMLTLGNSDLSP